MGYLWDKYEDSHFLDHVPPPTWSRYDKRALLNPVLIEWNPNRESEFYASHVSAVRGENKWDEILIKIRFETSYSTVTEICFPFTVFLLSFRTSQ